MLPQCEATEWEQVQQGKMRTSETHTNLSP